MTLTQQIKKGAKRALRGNWGKSMAIFLLLLGISLLLSLLEGMLYLTFGLSGFLDVLGTPDYYLDDIPNIQAIAVAITGTMAVFSFLILGPLQLGKIQWHLRLAGGTSEELSSIFAPFASVKQFFRSLWLSLLTGFLEVFWSIVFFLPAAAVAAALVWIPVREDSPLDAMLRTLGSIFCLFLVLIAAVCCWIFLQRYFFAYYLAAEDGEKSPIQAIRESVRIARNRCTEIAVFQFSFLGWALLSFFLLPLLFTVPYYHTSAAIYAKYRIEAYRRRTEMPPVSEEIAGEEVVAETGDTEGSCREEQETIVFHRETEENREDIQKDLGD